MDAEQLAREFHEAYERLAPDFGYKTRDASAKPWEEVPENNRKLMTAVCAEVMAPKITELQRHIEEHESMLGAAVRDCVERKGG